MSEPEGTGLDAPVRSVARAIDILEHMADSATPLTLADISKLVDIPRSTLHDIIKTLHAKGWLESSGDGPRYHLSIKTLQLGRSYLDASESYALHERILDSVAEQIDETVHLGRLFGSSIVYIGKRDPSHAIRLYSAIGRSLPAHATALGKAVLSRHDDGDVEQMLPDQLEQMTDRTVRDKSELLAELATIRERGYAIDDEESMEGVLCHAIALSDQEAISVSMPKWRTDTTDPEHIIKVLLEASSSAQVIQVR